MQSFGISLVSKCQCCKQIETLEHVLLFNKEAEKVWVLFSNLFVVPCSNTHTLFSRFCAWWNSSYKVKKVHIRVIISVLIAWFLWKARNASKYPNKKIRAFIVISQVLKRFRLFMLHLKYLYLLER